MKTIFMTMAAISALSIAAPASAQPAKGHETRSEELRMQIDAGIESGAISRAETTSLRAGLRQLMALEQQFSTNGISGREHASLQQRSAALRQQINMAERAGGNRFRTSARDTNAGNMGGRGGNERRAAWEARYDQEHRASWEARYDSERQAAWQGRFTQDGTSSPNARFDRPNRGDRFAGDVRVGQRHSARMVDLPAEYIMEYRANDQVYYGYDDGRIYKVARGTGLILGMFDLPS